MNTTNLSHKLQGCGLTDKESAIYLFLLKNGSSTATQVSESTGVNRATVYPVLESLELKFLLSTSSGLTVTKYSANTLVRYREAMRTNVDKYRRVRREVEDSVVSLRKRFASSKVRPKIVYISGKSGMRRAFDSTLQIEEKLIRVVSSTKKIFRTFNGYLPQYVYKRYLRGVAMKGIHPDDTFYQFLAKRPINPDDQFVSIPQSIYKFDVDVAIYEDKVSYMSHEKLYAIAIQSRAFSQVMKHVHELAWKYACRITEDKHTWLNKGK